MRIYLDYNATTPVDARVRDAMLSFLNEAYGNANSIHSSGQKARGAVDSARQSVANLIGAKPSEIVFTSGGTGRQSCDPRLRCRIDETPQARNYYSHRASCS